MVCFSFVDFVRLIWIFVFVGAVSKNHANQNGKDVGLPVHN